jgi:hypothetical protein
VRFASAEFQPPTHSLSAMSSSNNIHKCVFPLPQELNSSRKPSKTNAFRRLCSSTDYIIINNLISTMDVSKTCSELAPTADDVPIPLADGMPGTPVSNGKDDLMISLELAACSHTDLDDRGFPLVFSMFNLCPTAKGSATRESSCAAASSVAETLEYPESEAGAEQEFDSEGFPVLGEAPLLSAVPLPLPAIVFSKPLDPFPKKRKQDVLECRAQAKNETPKKTQKAKAKASPLKDAKSIAKGSPAKASPLQDAKSIAKGSPAIAKVSPVVAVQKNNLVLVAPHLTVTSEQDPRAQLTASVLSEEGRKTRVHVCTVTRSSWGPKFAIDMRKIKVFIEAGTVTKDECLKKRAFLKLTSMAYNVD